MDTSGFRYWALHHHVCCACHRQHSYYCRQSRSSIVSSRAARCRGMLLLAVLGVIINGAAVLRLRKGHSINERGFAQPRMYWVGQLCLSGVVMMFANLPILDPILSIAIAFYVLTMCIAMLGKVFQIILQAAPAAIDTDDVIGANRIFRKSKVCTMCMCGQPMAGTIL